jgi:hypothetical protein
MAGLALGVTLPICLFYGICLTELNPFSKCFFGGLHGYLLWLQTGLKIFGIIYYEADREGRTATAFVGVMLALQAAEMLLAGAFSRYYCMQVEHVSRGCIALRVWVNVAVLLLAVFP